MGVFGQTLSICVITKCDASGLQHKVVKTRKMVSHHATSSPSLDHAAASTGDDDVAEPPSRKPERQEEGDCDDATATTAMSWGCISQSFAGFEASLDDVSASLSLEEVNKVEVERGLNSSARSNECVPGTTESGEANDTGRFQHRQVRPHHLPKSHQWNTKVQPLLHVRCTRARRCTDARATY